MGWNVTNRYSQILTALCCMPRFEHFLQHVGYPEHIARFPPPLKYLRLEPNSLGSAAGIEGLLQRGGSRPSNRNRKPIEVRSCC